MTALDSLTALPRWNAWQTEEQPGRKPTKVPYSPHGGKAEADDPDTWGTHADAIAAEARLPKPFGAGGVGFQLGDGFAGIDLDSCRDPTTGTIQPWATAIIAAFASYTEVSPRGTGAKVFFRYAHEDLPALQAIMGRPTGKQWKQPGAGAHPPAIELYLTGRYFAVTGQHLAGSPDAVNTVPTDRITKLIEKAGPAFAGKDSPAPRDTAVAPRGDVYAKAMAIPAVAKRLNGDTDGLADKSKSGVAQSIARSLYNARWWQGDIAAVLASCPHTDGYDDGRNFERIMARCNEKPPTERPDGAPEFDGVAEPSKFHQFRRGENPYGDRRWLVHKMLPDRGVSILAGQYAAGKTFVALDLAVSVMTGAPFADRPVARRGGVLWLAAEGESEIPVRLEGIMRERGLTDADMPFLWRDDIQPLLTKAGQDDAVATAKAALAQMPDLALIVVDTMAAAAGWTDENSAAEAQAAMRVLKAMADASGAPVLAIDHLGKDGDAGVRGSTAKPAGAESVLTVLCDKTTAGEVSNRRLALHKVRGAKSGDVIPFELNEVIVGSETTCAVNWAVTSGSKPKSDDLPRGAKAAKAVLAEMVALSGDRTVAMGDWREECIANHRVSTEEKRDTRKKAFNRASARLLDDGLIKVTGDHVRIVAQGDEFQDVPSPTGTNRDTGQTGTNRDNVPSVPPDIAGQTGTDGTSPYKGMSDVPATDVPTGFTADQWRMLA